MWRTTFAVLVALLALFSGATAFADEPADAAHMKAQADAMMDSKRFAEAAQMYARLYAVSNDPTALYNEGRALEALGEYPDAIDRLEKFRDVASPALRARTRGLDEHIEELRGRVATIVVSTRVRGARLLVRGKDAGAVEGSREIRVRAGPATVEVTAEGYAPFKKEVDLQPRATERIDADLSPRAAATLAVRTTPTGLSVEVDGQPRGTSPFELQVTPGSHAIHVINAEGEDRRVDVSVRDGERRDVDVDMEAKPITAKWWFWTGVGVVVVGAVAAVVIVAASGGGTAEKNGDFAPGRIAAPLRIGF